MVAVILTATACGTAMQESADSSVSSGAGASDSVSETATSSPAPTGQASWSYAGDTGPDHWGDIAPGCATTPDSAESPIDIDKAALAAGPADAVTVRYTPAAFEAENDGHTVESVPDDTKQNSITIAGSPYYLQQFHFHAESEHRIDGVNAPMELHLVHKNDAGQLAVLGVLLESGAASEPLAELFSSIPAQENEDAPVELQHEIDLGLVIPTDPTLAQYQGSLTTPPCTEGVRWNVFLTPMTLSAEQIAAYTAVFTGNSRPVQPLNHRTVVQAVAGG